YEATRLVNWWFMLVSPFFIHVWMLQIKLLRLRHDLIEDIGAEFLFGVFLDNCIIGMRIFDQVLTDDAASDGFLMNSQLRVEQHGVIFRGGHWKTVGLKFWRPLGDVFFGFRGPIASSVGRKRVVTAERFLS